MKKGRIRAGIGGWTFAPWRGVFYPKGLPHAQELKYAAERLTSIEVNGTFYRTQSPATYRKWAAEAPEDFIFALKGPRFAVNRRVLAEAGDSVKRFVDSGIAELGSRLGPLLWQFAPTKKFDPADFGAFLELLPETIGKLKLRHVIEVRHDSFCTPDFVALLRQFNTPVVYADHAVYPAIADVTGDFVYARLQRGKDSIKTCYPLKDLDAWTKRLETWAQGKTPADLPLIDDKKKAAAKPRDVFAYYIHEGKVNAPAAAMETIKRLAR